MGAIYRLSSSFDAFRRVFRVVVVHHNSYSEALDFFFFFDCVIGSRGELENRIGVSNAMKV